MAIAGKAGSLQRCAAPLLIAFLAWLLSSGWHVQANDSAPPSGSQSRDVADPADKAVWGFYLGYPRALYAKIPHGPDGRPDPMLAADPEVLAGPHVTTYLVGIAVPEAPVGPPRFIPDPADGQMRWLPPHQLVMADLVTQEQPRVADGVFVVPGPAATEATVRTDPAMDDSIPGAALATAIRVGELWLPLTSHLSILYGVETGLLELKPFMTGHQQWTGPVETDRQADPLAEVLRRELP